MKTPKFTDLARYPFGYRHAKDTSVARTWKREFDRLKAIEDARKLEVTAKVRQIKGVAK